jgi:hypothetical protein
VKRKICALTKMYYSELIAFANTLPEAEAQKIKLMDLPDRFLKMTTDIFKLMGLIYPHEDITKAEQNIMAGTKEATAYAIEMLEDILKKEVKDVIFPLIENLTLSERAAICQILLSSCPVFKVMNGKNIDS